MAAQPQHFLKPVEVRPLLQSETETDKSRNVGIYEHFWFRTVAENQVLRIPHWFMVRDAHQ